MHPTIDAIGTSAQAGPDSRSIHAGRGGRRGAKTQPAWTTRIAASDGMKPSVMSPGGYASKAA